MDSVTFILLMFICFIHCASLIYVRKHTTEGISGTIYKAVSSKLSASAHQQLRLRLLQKRYVVQASNCCADGSAIAYARNILGTVLYEHNHRVSQI